LFSRKQNEEEYNGQVFDEETIPTKPGDPTLIVDLPDGQKLIVGAIEPGTVIEIATWRGTGRPDSRTTRMLLGAGVNNDARKKAISAPKSDKNDSVFTGEPEPRELANQLVSSKKEVIKGKHGVAKKVTNYQRIGYVAAGIVAAISIPMLVVNNGLFEFTAPDMGLGTKLGGAQSVVAITTQLSDPQSGDLVIATVKTNGDSSKILAKVAAVGGDKVLLQANGMQYEVPVQSLNSQVKVVVPFIGSIARIFGV
jgi:hypothetical protein